MSYLHLNKDFLHEVEFGNVSGWSFIRKFGHNHAIGTTIVPIAFGGVYQTPTALTSIEMLSSSANDTAAGGGGSGARTVYVEGIGTGYALQSETVSLDGTTPVALANQYYRIYRAYVVTSGTYASAVASSHAGTITIRTSGAGATWAVIGLESGIGLSQTLISAYTVPTGYKAYVFHSAIMIESTKVVSIFFFSRSGIDTVTAPYTPMRVMSSIDGADSSMTFNGGGFIGEFAAKTDIGYMGNVASGTASASIEFKIYLKAI